MASKTFLFLALAFAVVLLIASQVATAKDLTSNQDVEVDGGGGYNDPHGEYNTDGSRHGHGGHGKGGHHGGYGGGGRHGGCKFGCCGRGHYKHGGCKCCSTFEEATAYKQSQN